MRRNMGTTSTVRYLLCTFATVSMHCQSDYSGRRRRRRPSLPRRDLRCSSSSSRDEEQNVFSQSVQLGRVGATSNTQDRSYRNDQRRGQQQRRFANRFGSALRGLGHPQKEEASLQSGCVGSEKHGESTARALGSNSIPSMRDTPPRTRVASAPNLIRDGGMLPLLALKITVLIESMVRRSCRTKFPAYRGTIFHFWCPVPV